MLFMATIMLIRPPFSLIMLVLELPGQDPELVKKIGSATALVVRAAGIKPLTMLFHHVLRSAEIQDGVDVCYESYSEDPEIVKQMTDIILRLQGEIPADSRKGVPFVGGKDKVAACAKHFVGDSGTIKGINENDTVIDKHGLLNIHMPGYYHSIIKGVSTVMVSYSSLNGTKMHANHKLIAQFLKNTLKFRGFVISDWQGINKLTHLLLVMVPFNHTEFIGILTNHVNNKLVPMSRIDDAVGRIL
ncbi:putative glucan 1,3-beta-glucosidase [Rosa chinensis]|uniref:Putative glucan 1,3-beta-glucosidase n=1 Tax=Rosa chinensis TaxID=74649 RepID=A0A2P6QEY5_ROSCH|nr:putative glucan 1,3-beta-glucosidase [Rosa chinensis]